MEHARSSSCPDWMLQVSAASSSLSRLFFPSRSAAVISLVDPLRTLAPLPRSRQEIRGKRFNVNAVLDVQLDLLKVHRCRPDPAATLPRPSPARQPQALLANARPRGASFFL